MLKTQERLWHLAESLSRQLKIAVEHVVREEYELLILRELLASPLGNALVFKGGTALRLAYDSPLSLLSLL